MKTYRWRFLFARRMLPTTHYPLPTTNLLSLIVFCLLLTSCKQLDVYEKDTPIPKYEWQSNFIVKGSFNIPDTVARYKVFLVLRHNDAYKYNNIWLNVGWQPPGDSLYAQKLNIRLGNDAEGWEGTGMNDIWEVRTLLFPEPLPLKKGTYNFSIAQIMRDNPLLHIMSAGLRIENASGE